MEASSEAEVQKKLPHWPLYLAFARSLANAVPAGIFVGVLIAGGTLLQHYGVEGAERVLANAAFEVPEVREELTKNRKDLRELRAQLLEIQQSLDGVRQVDTAEELHVRAAFHKQRTYARGGAGGGMEMEAAPIDQLLFRLRRIRVRSAEDLLSLDPVSRVRRTPIGSPAFGEVTSGYGWRASPFTGRRQLHQGIDISIDKRAEVIATADGTVSQAGWRGGYGLSVVIDHGGGVETLYGHLSRITVKAGESVCRGRKVGLVGSTGHSTGPHLHYEVRQEGIAVNPERFIRLATLADRSDKEAREKF